MEKEDMTQLMVVIIKVNGIKIRYMERVFFITKMENPNMMGNGETIFMMDGGLYILKVEVGKNIKENLEME